MATYKLDPMHSEVNFKIRHLMIANVSGSFSKFEADMTAEKDDFSDASITFEADIDSISTGNEQRDGHLKGDEFFAIEKFPKITFVSTSIEKESDEDFVLTGNLTMHGLTKPVALSVTYGGTMTDFYGQVKAGFEIAGKINRKEFGLIWSGVTEAGGIVLGDDVKIDIQIQMIKQA